MTEDKNNPAQPNQTETDEQCPDCHCMKSGHHAVGCEGLGGNCGCTRQFPEPAAVPEAPPASKIDWMQKDREEAKNFADAFIEEINADHNDVIRMSRDAGCRIRDHIEELRRERKSSPPFAYRGDTEIEELIASLRASATLGMKSDFRDSYAVTLATPVNVLKLLGYIDALLKSAAPPADKPTFAHELSEFITQNNERHEFTDSEIESLINQFITDNHYSVHQKKESNG